MVKSSQFPLSFENPEPHSCTPHVRQTVLANVPFFAGLSEDSIREIDRRCRVTDYDTGNAVHHAGQPARRLSVVATGTAKLVRTAINGTEVLLDILRPGDFFGALPVLGATTYTASVWALTPLCVLSLDVSAFDEILDEHPSVARAGLEVMAKRLEQAQTHTHALAAATSEQRIAGALAMLADQAGVPRPEGGVMLDLPLSRDDLGALTGTASETVSRVLAQLRRDGVVDTGRGWVAVLNLKAIHDLAVV